MTFAPLAEPDREGDTVSGDRAAALRRAASAWVGLLGVGHVAQALLPGPETPGWTVAIVGATTAALAVRVVRRGGIREGRVLALVAVVQAVLFVLTLESLSPPLPHRGLLVALMVGYLGLGLLAAARLVPFPEAGAAVLLTASLTVALLGLEGASSAILDRQVTVAPLDPARGIRLIGDFQPDSVLGVIPEPGSHLEHVYPDNPRGYFHSRVVDRRTEFYVAYDFDERGCRTRELEVPAPPGTFRILMLGDSYVMGWGVHHEDMLSTVLEGHLNRWATASADGRRFEVVACGVAGYATREERIYYERRGQGYEPDLVLLGMVHNDNLSSAEEQAFRRLVPERWGQFFRALVLFEEIRLAYHRDFSRSMLELGTLSRRLDEAGTPFAVFAFDDADMPRRRSLVGAASSTTSALGIPFVDLASKRTGVRNHEELVVHRLEGHPNEIAHRAMAEWLMAWLLETGLLAHR